MQYLVGIGVFFFVGGLNAMLIRTELLQPNVHVFGANQYLTLVGMHGSMMMGMMTSGILGPFANWVVPLMIGSRRMAFPRIESFTFWLLMAAGVVLITTIFFGGFQTGWTGYEPLGAQGTAGYDAYIGFFALVGVSMCLLGLNLAATIVTMRAPGMTWSRLPIFGWAVLATAFLMVLAAPMLIAALMMGAMDRTIQTAFFIPGLGGSAYLWQNLFWVFGHPEVYVVALPGFGIVLELLPVFARKPLWGYRLAVAGMLGCALLSFFVWQHHLFVSGINADLRPFYMLSTEIISLPTGFIFLCVMGTLWRGRIRFTVPMLFCLAWVFNFLFGGISGVFLSDVPSDVTTHGSFFVMAHFHYTIMGGLVFTFFAAIYYWVPKMTGFNLNETLGKVHFWTHVHRLQLDVRAAVRARLPGHAAARGHLPVEPPAAERLGVSLGLRARDLDARVPLQRGVVAGLQARAGPGATRGIRSRPSGNCRRRYRCTTSSGSPCSTPIRIRTGCSRPRWGHRSLLPRAGRRRRSWKPRQRQLRFPRTSSPSRANWQPRALWMAVRLLGRRRRRSSSSRSCSPTSTCARSTPTTAGRSAR